MCQSRSTQSWPDLRVRPGQRQDLTAILYEHLAFFPSTTLVSRHPLSFLPLSLGFATATTIDVESVKTASIAECAAECIITNKV